MHIEKNHCFIVLPALILVPMTERVLARSLKPVLDLEQNAARSPNLSAGGNLFVYYMNSFTAQTGDDLLSPKSCSGKDSSHGFQHQVFDFRHQVDPLSPCVAFQRQVSPWCPEGNPFELPIKPSPRLSTGVVFQRQVSPWSEEGNPFLMQHMPISPKLGIDYTFQRQVSPWSEEGNPFVSTKSTPVAPTWQHLPADVELSDQLIQPCSPLSPGVEFQRQIAPWSTYGNPFEPSSPLSPLSPGVGFKRQTAPWSAEGNPFQDCSGQGVGQQITPGRIGRLRRSRRSSQEEAAKL